MQVQEVGKKLPFFLFWLKPEIRKLDKVLGFIRIINLNKKQKVAMGGGDEKDAPHEEESASAVYITPETSETSDEGRSFSNSSEERDATRRRKHFSCSHQYP